MMRPSSQIGGSVFGCGWWSSCFMLVWFVIGSTRPELTVRATAYYALVPVSSLSIGSTCRARRIQLRTIRLHADATTTGSASSSTTTTPASHFFSRKRLPDFYAAAAAASRDPKNVDDDDTAAADADDASARIFERLCRTADIDRPSKIQTMAWPILLSSTSHSQQQQQQQQAVVIADQTGSGKTLAYLIPLLHRLLVSKERQRKRRLSADEPKNNLVTDTTGSSTTSTTTTSKPNTAARPKLLILAPTSELADQIYSVCHKIAQNYNHQSSDKAPFLTAVLTSSGKQATNIRDQIRWLQQHSGNKRLDVLVSTPGRVATILRTRKAAETVLDLSHLQAIVLDEVDVLLLDETFGPQLQTVGQATTKTTAGNGGDDNIAQFVFVTATLPDSVVAQVTDQFPPGTVQLLKGPGLHRVAPTVSETLVDVSVPADQNRDPKVGFAMKAKALETALRQNRVRRTLVFCNTVQSCRQVENLLRRLDRQGHIYQVQAYHNALTAPLRNEHLDWFARMDDDKNYPKENSNISRILVCTDRAARGVDFGAAAVDHCVLFDFPTDPADYVRRVGRTARAGRTGAVTVLAYGWQLPVARSVMKQQPKRRGADKKDAMLFNDMALNNDYSDDDALNDPSSSKEYLGGVQGRRRQNSSTTSQRKSKKDKDIDKNSIEGNIASGRLWGQ